MISRIVRDCERASWISTGPDGGNGERRYGARRVGVQDEQRKEKMRQGSTYDDTLASRESVGFDNERRVVGIVDVVTGRLGVGEGLVL